MSCHDCVHRLRAAWAHLYKIDQHAKDYKRAKNEFNVWEVERHAVNGMVAIDGVCKNIAERLTEQPKEVV